MEPPIEIPPAPPGSLGTVLHPAWILAITILGVTVLAMGAANNMAILVGPALSTKKASSRHLKIAAAMLYSAGALIFGPPLSYYLGERTVPFQVGSDDKILAGFCATMAAACAWSIISLLWFREPVALVQFISVGLLTSCFGMGLKLSGIRVGFLGTIWLVCPFATGLVSLLLMRIIKDHLWRKEDPLALFLANLPAIFAALAGFCTMSLFYWCVFSYWSSRILQLWIPILTTILTSIFSTISMYYLSYYFFVPSIKNKLFKKYQEAWQEYFPQHEDLRQAERASLEQRGIFYEPPVEDENDSKKARSAVMAKERQNLSRIRAEDAFGYPQLFILAFILLIDGGILFSVTFGFLLSKDITVVQGTGSVLVWLLAACLGLSFGALFLSKFTLKWVTKRYYVEMTCSHAFTIEIGSLLPVWACLICGAPISLVHCRLVGMFAWLLIGDGAPDDPTDDIDKELVKNSALAWVCGLAIATSIPLACTLWLRWHL